MQKREEKNKIKERGAHWPSQGDRACRKGCRKGYNFASYREIVEGGLSKMGQKL
jgi:hypothetical protein